MAIYQYKCRRCGDFESRHEMGCAPATERCPSCGKKGSKRVYVPVGIVYRGSGFYTTDNKVSRDD
jgi:putative FmdB family regulatory protein